MFCMYVNTYVEDMHTTIIQKQIYEKCIFPPTFLTSVGSNYSSVGISTYGLHEALRKKKKKHPESVQYEILGSLFKNMNSVVCHP